VGKNRISAGDGLGFERRDIIISKPALIIFGYFDVMDIFFSKI